MGKDVQQPGGRMLEVARIYYAAGIVCTADIEDLLLHIKPGRHPQESDLPGQLQSQGLFLDEVRAVAEAALKFQQSLRATNPKFQVPRIPT